MLAHNFMTAKELKITDREHLALIAVLRMLERDEVPYHPVGRTCSYRKGMKPAGFNMSAFYAEGDCGTVHCIAGLAEIVGKLRPRQLVMKRFNHMRLFDLFEARDEGGRIRSTADITVAQAASALRNFLTLGEARWGEVLAHGD